MTTDDEIQNRKIEVFVSQLIDETADNESSDLNEQKIRKEIYSSYSTRHQLSRVSLVSESEQQTERGSSGEHFKSLNDSNSCYMPSLSVLSANSEIY